MNNKHGAQSKEQVIYNKMKNSFAKVILIYIVGLDTSVKRFKIVRYNKETAILQATVQYTKQNWLYYMPGVLPVGYTT